MLKGGARCAGADCLLFKDAASTGAARLTGEAVASSNKARLFCGADSSDDAARLLAWVGGSDGVARLTSCSWWCLLPFCIGSVPPSVFIWFLFLLKHWTNFNPKMLRMVLTQQKFQFNKQTVFRKLFFTEGKRKFNTNVLKFSLNKCCHFILLKRSNLIVQLKVIICFYLTIKNFKNKM